MNKLFNAAVFMPGEVIAKVQKLNIRLAWSSHARASLLDDRYGILPPGSVSRDFKGENWELVEAETSQSFNAMAVKKIVVRRDLDGYRSLVLVIYPNTGQVATCWVNLTTDTHRTLDKSRFSTSL